VARAVRGFPELLGFIHDGALTPTSARLMAPVLTRENSERLLAAAAYRSKRDVEDLVAQERPRPDVSESVRKVPAPRERHPGVPAPQLPGTHAPAAAAARSPEPPKARPHVVAPLSVDRYEVRFTASAATCEKLRLGRDLLRHAIPDGSTAEIVDRALTMLIEETTRKKFAVVRRPRPGATVSPLAREPSADVKRRVYVRDGGRCAFVAPGGRRCNSRAFLEFHHLTPYATGGLATLDKIELRCRAHNQYEAKVYFGPIHEAREEAAEVGRTGAVNGTRSWDESGFVGMTAQRTSGMGIGNGPQGPQRRSRSAADRAARTPVQA
jgi:hypothetical protein